jgi:metallophosphoesterase (TIGR03767 family)
MGVSLCVEDNRSCSRTFILRSRTFRCMARLIPTSDYRLSPTRESGYAAIEKLPGEVAEFRSDLGGDPQRLTVENRSAKTLLRILHVTDLHVMDAGSPARIDWVESRASDPKWHPLLHMARPHDTLANWGAAAFSRAIATNGGDFADLAIITGDNIDNAQRNELDAYLSLGNGGTFSFPYQGPQRGSWATSVEADRLLMEGLWPFWLPEGDRADHWSIRRGFPHIPGLLDASETSVALAGFDLPWLGVLGNHDVMRQGTVFTTPSIEDVAVGAWRALGSRVGFDPAVPFDSYMADPGSFTDGQPRFDVSANPHRRSITRTEFISAHIESGGHGFRTPDQHDYVYETEHVRVIVLDTNHPTGHYQGSIGLAQLAWLSERLEEAIDRPVVIASHHGAASLDNTFGDPNPTDRRHAEDLEHVLLRFGNVVAWLVGHRHVHRIRPVQNPNPTLPGFWEITTSSTIDWPCQIRAVEIVGGSDGSVGVRTIVLDHDETTTDLGDLSTSGLAGWHREIALNTGLAYRGRTTEGVGADRNTVLARPAAHGG